MKGVGVSAVAVFLGLLGAFWMIIVMLFRWIEGEWRPGWVLELLHDAFGRSRNPAMKGRQMVHEIDDVHSILTCRLDTGVRTPMGLGPPVNQTRTKAPRPTPRHHGGSRLRWDPIARPRTWSYNSADGSRVVVMRGGLS